ncbi:MAG: hypothetical protein QOG34_462 [Frankiaceae bacterium]|jgi:uncharacterized membrane protein YkvA (DUF1232 family)|nr:hypothetical protein [Frankiaceae bacterium]
MPWWAELLISLGTALLVVWIALMIVLWRSGRGFGGLAEAARLLPDLLRLVSRLACDPSLPRGVRIRLWLLLGYLASPIDIIPDFIPLVGYADDALVVAIALRSVVRAAGPEPLDRHWPGSAQGLSVVRRLAGLDKPSTG